MLPRGGGTSQAGQTVNSSLVIDCSKYLTHILELDVAGRRCRGRAGHRARRSQPRGCKPHGLWFPVDVSTASRATIGGMTANNSCGGAFAALRQHARERAGDRRAAGRRQPGAFRPGGPDLSDMPASSPLRPLARDLLALGRARGGRDRGALSQGAAPGRRLQSRRAGAGAQRHQPRAYPGRLGRHARLLHRDRTQALAPARPARGWRLPFRLASTPRWTRRSTSSSWGRSRSSWWTAPCSGWRATSPCSSPPSTRCVQRRARRRSCSSNSPKQDRTRTCAACSGCDELIGDLGFDWRQSGAKWGGVVEVLDPKLQAAITELRTAGLNIMMSMKEEGKPVSFVEDCAVPLRASRGLHGAAHGDLRAARHQRHLVRACLGRLPACAAGANLRLDKDVKAMRAIAEEAFALVREYKGSHSGEHGDGIVRSEFHEQMFGARLVRAFEEVKDRSIRTGCSIRARSCGRRNSTTAAYSATRPDYAAQRCATRLDWSAYPGRAAASRARSRCATTTAPAARCAGGVMCPSYRVTRDERDVTRGRANTLRLAITGQLGPDAFTSRHDGGDAEALRLLQGLPARMPDRRRHGADEDRGAGGAGGKARRSRCTTG